MIGSHRYIEVNMSVQSGDSGSGMVFGGSYNNPGSSNLTIDGIVVQSVDRLWPQQDRLRMHSAYDYKSRLSFDFNCAPTVQVNQSHTAWGLCPKIDR